MAREGHAGFAIESVAEQKKRPRGRFFLCALRLPATAAVASLGVQAIADVVTRRRRLVLAEWTLAMCNIALIAAAARTVVVALRLEAVAGLRAALVLRERVAVLVDRAAVALAAARILALSLSARARAVAALRPLVAGEPGASGRLVDADLGLAGAAARTFAAAWLILARTGLAGVLSAAARALAGTFALVLALVVA